YDFAQFLVVAADEDVFVDGGAVGCGETAEGRRGCRTKPLGLVEDLFPKLGVGPMKLVPATENDEIAVVRLGRTDHVVEQHRAVARVRTIAQFAGLPLREQRVAKSAQSPGQ